MAADPIGVNYADLRKPDPRIERVIARALGAARSVLNVGAGTGFYEPADREVTAVEPSAEMIRQRRPPIVLLTFDPAQRGFWLAVYVPELVTLDDGQMPHPTDYTEWIGPVEISAVPVPHDCLDGFLYAYWRRPAAYLDPKIRAAMSSFWALGDVSEALQRLSGDLASGVWAARYGHLLDLDAYDAGYRLVITT